jgi:ParB family transcriptional regulator, chromosome partitioning protein
VPKRPTMSDRKAETPRVAARVDATLMGHERDRREVVELLLDEVMPSRQQPRQSFDPGGLAELAESIKLHGVLEPVIVRAIPLTLYEGGGRQYELVAGERRWRAAALAERRTVPALVLPEMTSDQTVLELAIIENLQREDLHPLDEAAAFGRMQADLRYSYAQIAERLGKSKGYVQNRLRLLQLDDDLRQLVAERPDTLTHVYELAKIPDPAQRKPLIEAVLAEGLSFVETRGRVQALLSPPTEVSNARQTVQGGAEAGTGERLGAGEAYLYKYGQEFGGLSPRERSAFSAASARIEQLLDNPGELSGADWTLLEKLALHLSALLDARREIT